MAPKVFISYSHDSDAHKAWVLQLATDLRGNGVDVTLDRWDLVPGQDIVAFMQAGVVDADRVLLVCTENYVHRAEAGTGGVGFERLIVTAELVENIDTRKFIPLVRENPSKRIPIFLGPRLYLDFSEDANYEAVLGEILRELHGQPGDPKPPLGPSPFSGAAEPPPPADRASPSGLSETGSRILDAPWFEQHATQARSGLDAVGLVGAMEIRFGLHDPIGKSQVELLNAVRGAQIKTFGWPIGVMLENREEYRPRPTADGIRAEVSIAERALSGETSYDYWAASGSGSFYLLQSLFEDVRSEGKLFFNTRIVRVAEAVMFGARLYGNLGVSDDARLSVRISHSGLRGRELTSAGPSRHIHPSTTAEDVSQTEFVDRLASLETDVVQHVHQVLAPLFMLFDFREFDEEIYQDIVTRFSNGDVS